MEGVWSMSYRERAVIPEDIKSTEGVDGKHATWPRIKKKRNRGGAPNCYI